MRSVESAAKEMTDFTTEAPARRSRNQSSNRYFTTEAWFENLTTLREIEGQSSQSSEYFLIKNSLLRALRASALRSLLDR